FIAPAENAIVPNGVTKDGSRSSSPQLIVPDEVYPEAILETVDSDPENLDAGVEEPEIEELVEKSTRDQEVMCQPTMISCAISCKPILKSQGIQTGLKTY
ncbi:TRASH domain-containing protein, partial [Nephila pilipes]